MSLVSMPVPRNVWLLATIVGVGLLIRATYVLIAPQIDPVLRRDPLYGDASGYHVLAINLLKGLGLTWDGETPTSYRMPGYPVFLAMIYLLAGPNLQAVRLVQAILGALTCVPVYIIARRLSGDVTATLAGLGVALHPLLIYMTGWLYSETLFLWLLWIGLWLLVRMLDSGLLRRDVLAGIVLGLATLVRPEIVVIPLFAVGIGVLLRWPRMVLGSLVVVQLALMSVVLPWAVRNMLVHQAFVFLTTNTGSNLYGGNNPLADGGSRLDVPFVLLGFSEIDSDHELTRRAWEWIRTNPRAFLSILPSKLIKFFSPGEMENRGNALGQWVLLLNLAYGSFLLLMVFGAVKSWKEKIGGMLIALVAWYMLMALIFYGGTRVALPVAPALVVLAASGVEQLRSRWLWTSSSGKVNPKGV